MRLDAIGVVLAPVLAISASLLATCLAYPSPETPESGLSKKLTTKEFEVNNTNVTNHSLKSPLIFVPGDGGSQLEARLNKRSRVHYICDLKSDWFDIWLNIHLLVPVSIDCLIDNLILRYDPKTHTSLNSEGVEIRPHNFGSVDSVEYLDILKLPKTDYFHTIIDTLVRNNSYQREVDMFGSGYDFRKAPNELDEFFVNLTNLIEKTYTINGFRPVTLICHSMGCLNAVYLLNNKTQDWKDVFVKRLVTIAAPWGGSFKAISAMLFGDDLGIPLMQTAKLQMLQSTFPSLMYLFPIAPTYSKQQVLIETPQKNYTLTNLHEILIAKNMTDQLSMWQDTRPILESIKAPNVELWCLYSNGIDTTKRIVYETDITGKYSEETGDGDGTVNIESLRACENFASHQDKPIKTFSFHKTDHIDILRGAATANFISKYIMSCDEPGNEDCGLSQI